MSNKELSVATQNTNRIEKRATNLPNVYLIDWNNDGLLKEIAVVLEAPDGSIYGMEIDKMHRIDKIRLKKFLVSIHADKYPLWDLLSQGTLNNGMSALEFFHNNYVKVKRPRGAILGSGLATLEVRGSSSESLIGTSFTNGDNGTVASETPRMM